MSNWIYCTLDVLAGSGEIDQIHERLVRPSLDLVNWVAESNHQPVDEVTGWLKKLLHFQLIQRFDSDFIDYSDFLSLDLTDATYRPIVDRHLNEVSEAHPKAIFLLDYRPDSGEYEKKVIRSGKVVREIVCRRPQAAGQHWLPLDIFEPFTAEHESRIHKFGSLWDSWLDAAIAAATELKNQQGAV